MYHTRVINPSVSDRYHLEYPQLISRSVCKCVCLSRTAFLFPHTSGYTRITLWLRAGVEIVIPSSQALLQIVWELWTIIASIKTCCVNYKLIGTVARAPVIPSPRLPGSNNHSETLKEKLKGGSKESDHFVNSKDRILVQTLARLLKPVRCHLHLEVTVG